MSAPCLCNSSIAPRASSTTERCSAVPSLADVAFGFAPASRRSRTAVVTSSGELYFATSRGVFHLASRAPTSAPWRIRSWSPFEFRDCAARCNAVCPRSFLAFYILCICLVRIEKPSQQLLDDARLEITNSVGFPWLSFSRRTALVLSSGPKYRNFTLMSGWLGFASLRRVCSARTSAAASNMEEASLVTLTASSGAMNCR